MAKTASKVIEQAKSWLGKNEADGSHKAIIDVYNAHKPLPQGYKVKYTDAWCATFVSAVAIKTGCADIIPTECSCPRQIELFKKKGTWIENEARTPSPGDIIYYDWQDNGIGDNKGTSDHVGIVEKVSDGKITVIEGNYSNAVKRRTLAVNGKYVRGYGVPKYDKEKVVAKNATTTKKSVETVAQEVLKGLWGNGAVRQAKLIAAGYNYKEVQAMVNTLASGKKTVYEIAKEVIAGKWGTGTTRKQKLTAAGYDYNAVQKAVNQLMK